jgi:hypothetical protein
VGIRLSELKARVKTAQVEFDDEVIDFGYHPNAFTMEVAEEVEKAANANDLSTVAAMLEPIVEWWDVLDDKDKRIPPTAENMRAFPLNFLMKIMDKVGEDQRPPEGVT